MNQMNKDKDKIYYLQTKYWEDFNVSDAISAKFSAPLTHHDIV